MDFLCNECAKSSAKEVDLVIHQSRAHDKRHFSCEVCQENFIRKDKHRNHMRKHNNEKKTPKNVISYVSDVKPPLNNVWNQLKVISIQKNKIDRAGNSDE